MSEADIAAELANKIDKEETPAPNKSEPEKPDQDPDAFHNNDPLENTLQRYQLMEYFDVPLTQRHSAEVQQNISSILQWARSANPTGDFADVLSYIRSAENQFGNTLKEQRIFKLATHIKIQRSIKILQEKERSIYG